ncbi:MAG: histidinol phosphatase [Bacteroidetes bacterium]|uniref:protein-tyrosine-phosphatase n=1 Tax=Candidatus Cryptobacteroides merdavium TaxID=2840769 RepID=A0A9D9EDI4_9BACT|nr:histidinol phosphatase [Candidatus Cryptobacteroides merdavium]
MVNNRGFLASLFSKGPAVADLPFETDMHSHVLPGVDDGFRDIEHSGRAVAELAGLGVKNMILTPHIYPELYPENDFGSITGHFAGLHARLSEASGINFKIAGEHMVYEGFEDTFSGDLLMLPGRHMLIEMSYAYESTNIDESIFRLNCMDFHPVLAHPERYIFYSPDLKRIRNLVDKGCELQMNILSLGGFYGKGAALKAAAILEKGLYSYIGTDLHSLAQIDMLKSMRFKKKHVSELERIMQNTTALFNLE